MQRKMGVDNSFDLYPERKAMTLKRKAKRELFAKKCRLCIPPSCCQAGSNSRGSHLVCTGGRGHCH